MQMRSGATLIEALLMTALGLGLMAAASGMMRKSGSIMDATTHTMDLQVGVRNLLENMIRDVGASQQIMDPGGQPDRTLMLVKPLDDDVAKRLTQNTDKAFPFMSSAGPTTVQQMDALRVTYTWDATKRTVRRKEEQGIFRAESEPATPALLTRFSFQNPQVRSDRELATSVETMALAYIGYDQTPVAADATPILKAVGSGMGFEKTACIAVRINAQFDEGLYKGGTEHKMPKIEIVTKIWSIKRRSDEMYREYFSSTDEDLRW